MISQQEIKEIKQIVGEFLTKMGVVDFQVDVQTLINPGSAGICITLNEPQFLIGQDGKTLLDIQRLIRIIISKKYQNTFSITLDINDYLVKKIKNLKSMANESADQVALTGLLKTLPPMSSYERRIVHAELATRQDVTTESRGEGEARSVVITPK